MEEFEFSPDLDDGELWLPSDIFPDVGVNRHRAKPDDRSELAYMEDLAQQLAAFGLLDRSTPWVAPATAPNLYPEVLGPALRLGPMDRDRRTGFAYDGFVGPAGRSLTCLGAGAGAGGSTPVYHHRLHSWKPALSQVDGLGHLRGRAEQMPLGRGGPNRTFPARVGGSGRKCGGTGVFLPRVVVDVAKKKPSGEQQRQHTRKAAVEKQGISLQASTEMGLPKDWTY